MHWQADLRIHSRSLYEVKWEGGSLYVKANTRKCKKQGKESKSARRPYPTINLLLVLGACDSRLHPNVHRLLLIACRLPITSAEAERSLFLLRRLKTYNVYHGRGASCTPISYRHALQRPGTSRRSLYKVIHGGCSYSLCLRET